MVINTIPARGDSAGARIAYAVNYAAGAFGVPCEWIAVDHKRARLLVHDRPHDEEGAQVTRVLRASQTGRELWFEVVDDRLVALHDPAAGEDE